MAAVLSLIHILKDEEHPVYVYGLSYEHQEITAPLYDKAAPCREEGLHILMAHGGDVYKRQDEGRRAFMRFVEALG